MKLIFPAAVEVNDEAGLNPAVETDGDNPGTETGFILRQKSSEDMEL